MSVQTPQNYQPSGHNRLQSLNTETKPDFGGQYGYQSNPHAQSINVQI